MIKRLLIVVLFIITTPLLFAAPIIMAVMGVIGVIKYIINGTGEKDILKLVATPIWWIIDIPYKIIGKD